MARKMLPGLAMPLKQVAVWPFTLGDQPDPGYVLATCRTLVEKAWKRRDG